MKNLKKYLLVFFVLSLINIVGLSCLWDQDTIEMERQRFPNTLELITGNFVRHSTEFYEWRIKDRIKQLKSEPENLAFYDDLAVAYDKVGNSKKAIQIMFKKEKIKSGLYETYANLGTFYIHNKQLKKGLFYINKAIEINPDAHFGREVYQKYLVEYHLLGKKKIKYKSSFYYFLIRKLPNKSKTERGELSKVALQKAIKGVLGMMRFGHYESPVLLKALGDLLKAGSKYNIQHINASQLAFLAYRQASPETRDKKIEKPKNRKDIFSLHPLLATNRKYHDNSSKFIDNLNKQFLENIEQGKKLYRQIKQDEITWITQEKNPEVEFSKKYYGKKYPKTSKSSTYPWILLILGVLGVLTTLAFTVYRKNIATS